MGRFRSITITLWMGLLIAIGGWVAPASAQSDTPPLTVEQYQDQLNTLADQFSDEVIDRDAVTAQLGTQPTIQFSDGTEQPIDHAFLLDALANDDAPDWYIIELLREAGAAPSRPPVNPYALDTLDEVLNRPEFVEELPPPTWLEELQRWLFRQYANVMMSDAGLLLGWPLVIVLIVLLLGVLAYWLRGVGRSVVADNALAIDSVHEEGLTLTDALAKAQANAEAGDYRSAVRYLYLSTLLLLDEKGALRYDRTKTNREYLRSMSDGKSPQLRPVLQDVIDVFDRVWYGFQSIGSAEYDRYAKRVQELRNS